MSKILIIDDDDNICRTLVKRFERAGHDMDCSHMLEKGLSKLFANNFDVLFLDVNLPDGNGLEAIEIINDHLFPPEIIVMTGDIDPDGVEFAMKSRAWDYILKSSSYQEFEFSLNRALKYRQQKQSRLDDMDMIRDPIVGESREMKVCLEKVLKVSKNDSPVLITGETGTGKELIAKAIHNNSLRSESNFIVVDCAALPEHLVESVLFGHTKGAFTGAERDKEGLVRLADAGTLFLDELGELPLDVQRKFLRTLQEKKFRPVGGKKEISSDFRLIAATHRDVGQMAKKGGFREDLYYRISAIQIDVPALRHHMTDIEALAAFHIKRKKRRSEDIPHELSSAFLKELFQYPWPGNVRELFNTIDYACNDAYQETMLFPKHLPEHIRTHNIQQRIKDNPANPDKAPASEAVKEIVAFKDHIEMAKSEYMQHLMAATKGDIKESCRVSGLSKGHLYRLLQQFGLKSS